MKDYRESKESAILREKAEELWKRNLSKTSSELDEADVLKLMHELEVHQIELEMQNDELRQAYQTAETALKKYTMLYDLAPMGYFTLGKDGTICELNFTGADSLINCNFKLFVSDESRPIFNDFFRKVYKSNSKESCEVNLGYNNSFLCMVYMEGIVTDDDQKCLLSVIDISNFTR